jgi:hypothetical protein
MRNSVALLFYVTGIALGCRSGAAPTIQTGATNTTGIGGVIEAYAVTEGDSSLIYVKTPGAKAAHRLTTRRTGWESGPAVSKGGNVIAYALADNSEGKSEVWVSRIDGSHAHRVSAPDEDGLMPAFGPDERTLLYVKSRFSGSYSPIARPRKHEFDIVKITVNSDGPVPGSSPIELTQQHFFDLRSISVSPDGERFLVSTSGYPIGALLEEFDIAKPLQMKRIFQPHVSGEPAGGAEFGFAAYTHDGLNIVFTAATDSKGGNFDYNLYQMSDVTGGDIVTLARHSGSIDSLEVTSDGGIVISSEGKRYELDAQAHVLRQN